jgi:hypothetical protein
LAGVTPRALEVRRCDVAGKFTEEERMSRLTEDRLAAARPILDRFRDKLRRDRFFSAHALERELSDALRLGHQELTGLVVDLLDEPDYRLVAAYYMEHVNADALGPPDQAPRAPGVAAEFEGPLARLYGVDSYDAADREGRRTEFWRAALADSRQGGLPEEEYEGPRFTAHDRAGREYVLTPVYRRRTDPSGHTAAGGGYETGDLIRLVTPSGSTVRRDGTGRYTVLDGGAHGGETTLTSGDPKAV